MHENWELVACSCWKYICLHKFEKEKKSIYFFQNVQDEVAKKVLAISKISFSVFGRFVQGSSLLCYCNILQHGDKGIHES